MRHTTVVLLVKEHKLAHACDSNYEDCIHFVLEKCVIALKSTSRVCDENHTTIAQSCYLLIDHKLLNLENGQKRTTVRRRSVNTTYFKFL